MRGRGSEKRGLYVVAIARLGSRSGHVLKGRENER